jgi:cyclic pyranopterin phosphate synthase
MPFDSFNRKIDYMRLSVTDRCNLRCSYCMPEEGVKIKPHKEILLYEEIKRFATAAARTGISKIRVTGGEPLVRKDIVDLIKMLAAIDGIEDLSLTTNGLLLAEYGQSLKDAGLNRVNISLDSLDPAVYKRLTRRGELSKAISGLQAAIELGLEPVKVNAVLIKGVNDNPKDFIKLIYDYPVHVRFIELMPVSMTDKDSYLSVAEFEKNISSYVDVENIENLEGKAPKGAGPARYITFKGALGTIGFISAVSNHFCSRCNRIRLTADGKLRPCLFSNTEFDIREQLRSNKSEDELAAFIEEVIRKKPERHNIDEKYGNRRSSEDECQANGCNNGRDNESGSGDKLPEKNCGDNESCGKRMMSQIGG